MTIHERHSDLVRAKPRNVFKTHRVKKQRKVPATLSRNKSALGSRKIRQKQAKELKDNALKAQIDLTKLLMK